jgi:hypothetical protein
MMSFFLAKKGRNMKINLANTTSRLHFMRLLFVTLILLFLSSYCSAALNTRLPNVDVNVTPQIIGSDLRPTARAPQNCSSCCVYGNQYYSEGALVEVNGRLLQCKEKSDMHTLSTRNIFIWNLIEENK